MMAQVTPYTNQSSERIYQTNFQQAVAQAQAASISIQTDEGDIVTINNSSSLAAHSAGSSWLSPVGSGQDFTMQTIAAQSMGFSIQGDLNEEELADIAKLVSDLSGIASSFFSGQYDTAMGEALALGDLGSLSAMSASFSQTTSVMTRLASNHPLPAGLFNDQELAPPQLLEEIRSDNQGPDFGETLRARWQQIEEYLAQQKIKEEVRENQDTELLNRQEAALKMMDRIQETMEKHPHLSPFSTPLALKALNNAAINQAQTGGKAHNYNQLKEDLFQQLNNWLIGPEKQQSPEPISI